MQFETIKYKQFNRWCNRRAADGRWGQETAMYCIKLCQTMNDVFFLKRERVWKNLYEQEALDIVNQVEHKIELAERGELRAKLDAEAKAVEECRQQAAKSVFNGTGYRQIGDSKFYMDVPFKIRPTAAYTGETRYNVTNLDSVKSINLGDYMSQQYDSCSLAELLFYNERMHKFVYTVDINPQSLDIFDPLLVLTSDTVDGFDKEAIDKFLLDIIEPAFQEYDKDGITEMVDGACETIQRLKADNKKLQEIMNL